ncbi:MAG: hypothetical protein RLZZ387_3698 [Chloroflexota bacterium]
MVSVRAWYPPSVPIVQVRFSFWNPLVSAGVMLTVPVFALGSSGLVSLLKLSVTTTFVRAVPPQFSTRSMTRK